MGLFIILIRNNYIDTKFIPKIKTYKFQKNYKNSNYDLKFQNNLECISKLNKLLIYQGLTTIQ